MSHLEVPRPLATHCSSLDATQRPLATHRSSVDTMRSARSLNSPERLLVPRLSIPWSEEPQSGPCTPLSPRCPLTPRCPTTPRSSQGADAWGTPSNAPRFGSGDALIIGSTSKQAPAGQSHHATAAAQAAAAAAEAAATAAAHAADAAGVSAPRSSTRRPNPLLGGSSPAWVPTSPPRRRQMPGASPSQSLEGYGSSARKPSLEGPGSGARKPSGGSGSSTPGAAEPQPSAPRAGPAADSLAAAPRAEAGLAPIEEAASASSGQQLSGGLSHESPLRRAVQALLLQGAAAPAEAGPSDRGPGQPVPHARGAAGAAEEDAAGVLAMSSAQRPSLPSPLREKPAGAIPVRSIALYSPDAEAFPSPTAKQNLGEQSSARTRPEAPPVQDGQLQSLCAKAQGLALEIGSLMATHDRGPAPEPWPQADAQEVADLHLRLHSVEAALNREAEVSEAAALQAELEELRASLADARRENQKAQALIQDLAQRLAAKGHAEPSELKALLAQSATQKPAPAGLRKAVSRRSLPGGA